MRIGLNDIDPVIASAFTARVAENCYPTEKYLHANIDWERKGTEGMRPPLPDEEKARAAHEKREDRHSMWTFGTLMLPVVSGGVVGFSQGLLPGIAAWLVPTLFGAWQMKRSAAKSALEREISPVEFRAAVPLLGLSPGEALYCQALLQLMETPKRVHESTARDILRSINELVARDREICGQLEQVRIAIGVNPMELLEEERVAMQSRLDATADSVEGANIEQSIRLCDARLDNARALHSAPRRLEAQQEAIRQALASVPAALMRQSTSALSGEELEVQAIVETVSQIAQNAYAEEQAVAEVLALRH